MTSIGRFILAICADESVPAGILKAKVSHSENCIMFNY